MATLAYTPSLTTSSIDDDSRDMPRFAFAQIHGDVHLVQLADSPASALVAADVKVFRHEFITIFRYSHSTSVHPADIHVLYALDQRCALYEEDKGTVFLAKDAMAQMQKLTALSRPAGRYGPYARPPRRGRFA
ncbi:uncharacterized protein PHACADRAFT_253641 [Phanerochaete carnosa HHB-10118-sp]|uniref:Uncharacterized protein n=1 Tax=Phanerochaete carnosa (strain HHB-10118-sp) TaxID=650164 RepID=K5WBX5_PHACS|nr:uncharacterized protein PHACADRAFT_253641 [Phanerochaete carnosa HHB-10118-sp]EKM56484.1 hypothetical protein PHACADRAFT_253641 [Phanerochaete carnosa HHB-10118-sp]